MPRTTCCCGARAGWASRRCCAPRVARRAGSRSRRASRWSRSRPTRCASLAALFAALGRVERRFLVFIDDLGFEDGDGAGPRALALVARRRGRGAARQRAPCRDLQPPRDRRRAMPASRTIRSTRATRSTTSSRWPTASACRSASTTAARTITWRSSPAMPRQLGLAWDEADALEWSKPPRRPLGPGRLALRHRTRRAGRAGALASTRPGLLRSVATRRTRARERLRRASRCGGMRVARPPAWAPPTAPRPARSPAR